MTLACGLSESDRDVFAAVLGGPVHLVPDVTAALRALRASRKDLPVILGPELSTPRALRLVAQVRAARPRTLVVMLRPAANRLERQLAGECGVDAILPAGDIPAAARRCRLFLDTQAGAGRGRVVTVFAGKGGCGKTTIAVNLAVALADNTGSRVCLVDLDLRSGDVAVTLGLEPLRTIAPVTPADAGTLQAILTPFRHRLDCVIAPVRPGDAERIESDGVEATLDALVRCYDIVVVDTPPLFTAAVLSALDRSEHHVLVSTPERPAMYNLRRTLDTLDLLGHRPDNRSVVFNRSDSGVGITAGDVESALHAPIAAHVPSSRAVAASINSCLPLMVSSPDHPVSSAIRQFALARLSSPAATVATPYGGAMT
jgi:pilus assembly protein CpaE